MERRNAGAALALGIGSCVAPLLAGIVFTFSFLDRSLYGIAIGALIGGPIVTLLTAIPGIIIAIKERRLANAARQPTGTATAALVLSLVGLVGILGCGGLCLLAVFVSENANLKF